MRFGVSILVLIAIGMAIGSAFEAESGNVAYTVTFGTAGITIALLAILCFLVLILQEKGD